MESHSGGRNMVGLLIVGLCLVDGALTKEAVIMCNGNRTILESPGDAVVAAFIDTNYGPYCNETTSRGFQEISTALYVIQTLNKFDYVPGLTLGLKIYDTCHDSSMVYKQALMEAVSFDCVDYYELGILVPSIYSPVLKPLGELNVLPVSVYKNANMTKALVETLVEFTSTKYEIIDALLVDSSEMLARIVETSRTAGICIKSLNELSELDADTELVIVAVGTEESIRSWLLKERGDTFLSRKTWIVLPIDDAYVDDLVPTGSYIIKTEPFEFDLLQELGSVDDFLSTSEYPVIHSPYLLGIGKSLVEIAKILSDLQRETCPHGEACVLPRFVSSEREKVALTNSDVYEALHILPKSHIVKYVVSRRLNEEEGDQFSRVVTYDANVIDLSVRPEVEEEKMPKLCVKKLTSKCKKCANFKFRADDLLDGSRMDDTRASSRADQVLKSGILVPIFLTVMACGTLASLVVVIFIIYRYYTERILDGNPSLTILLVLANIFVLQTILPFSMNDHRKEMKETINSRKIFVCTLSLGIVFSTMLSRAFFLAFSTGGVFTSHVNGYLQALMVFFMAGVQVALSTMYFFLSTDDSAEVVRSLKFIGLLAYDIFLLVVLFVVCCFIAQIQRNYREGKCFFGTVIGLLMAWAVWLTCFVFVEIEMRDTVVCAGIIATGYIIIIGILIPRTYYMVTQLPGGSGFLRRYETTDLGPDPRTGTVARQGRRPFYDHAHPMESITGGPVHQIPRYPNYYGSSSPNTPYYVPTRVSIADPPLTRLTTYNNYGYHPEMREVDNPYVVPRVCLENPEGYRTSMSRSGGNQVCYAQPRREYAAETASRDSSVKDCIETEIYVEGRRHLSPNRIGPNEAYPSRCSSPRLYQTEETIREEEEDRNAAPRMITRL